MTSYTILIVALFGFALSAYIRYKHSRGEALVCFIGEDCNKVVDSRYSVSFGIPNEVIGLIYYGFLALMFGYLSLTATSLPTMVEWVLKAVTTIAALFSVRLIAIQAFTLREWCEWCLVSSGLSIIISILIWI